MSSQKQDARFVNTKPNAPFVLLGPMRSNGGPPRELAGAYAYGRPGMPKAAPDPHGSPPPVR
ncbi:hypothetical protein, partial [Streptomyces sp. FH025]|uniref:hypothetical protein n=1 Tax=Streptomyces sp. FH025 TaxID=2815937 RepID=UPI001A9D94B8